MRASATSLLIILALVCGSVTGHAQPKPDPISTLASLTASPQGPKAADAGVRMRHVIYTLAAAKHRSIGPEQALAQAFQANGTTGNRASVTRNQILKNWSYAISAGLLTKENLALLRTGKPPLISRGSSAGQPVASVRLVPESIHPEFAQELANIALLPQKTADRRARSGNVNDPTQLVRLLSMDPTAPAPGMLAPTSIQAPPVSQAWYEDIEIPLNSSIDMRTFGGPELFLVIRSETTSAITYNIVDQTQLHPVLRTDSNGYTYTEMVPTVESLKVSKKNGISLPGRLSKLYPLYENPELTVYFFDTLATRQNYRKLVIAHAGPAPGN